jgi:hypothetical protein
MKTVAVFLVYLLNNGYIPAMSIILRSIDFMIIPSIMLIARLGFARHSRDWAPFGFHDEQ